MLRSVADARYFSQFGFASRCGELRGFASENPQTVETTVKSQSLAHALRVEFERHSPSHARYA